MGKSYIKVSWIYQSEIFNSQLWLTFFPFTGLILGAFFYGYIVTQLPGGWLASRYGGKVVFGCGVLLTSVAALFTPAAAYHSVAILMLVRVVEGLGQVVKYIGLFQPKWIASLLLTMIFFTTQLSSASLKYRRTIWNKKLAQQLRKGIKFLTTVYRSTRPYYGIIETCNIWMRNYGEAGFLRKQ